MNKALVPTKIAVHFPARGRLEFHLEGSLVGHIWLLHFLHVIHLTVANLSRQHNGSCVQ